MLSIRGTINRSKRGKPTRRVLRTQTIELNHQKALPNSAKIVIVGGGVIGASVGYHLTKLGHKDVVLLEQGTLTSGTTWHAAGLIGQMRKTKAEIELSTYGTKLYESLQEETGLSTGYKRCGSISVARCQDRMTNFHYGAAAAASFGITAEIVSPDRVKEICSYLRTDDILGGLWLPGDGSAISSDVCNALAKGARNRGMRVFENTRVESIQTKYVGNSQQVVSVTTDGGHTISCETVVNCAGQWARQLGKKNGVHIPLFSAEHYYVITAPNSGVPTSLPIIRDQDGYIYAREWSGGIILGGFEPEAKICFAKGVPDSWQFGLFEEDWDHFQILMENGMHRIPFMNQTSIQKMINGPESFTPDTHYIIGEAPQLKNYFVAAGFNSSGIASAGGAGRAVAEWIDNKTPTMDLWAVDIKRFGNFANNSNFLIQRTAETLGQHYAIGYPRKEFLTGRPMRMSPLYGKLKEAGACFGSKMGWERANWFATEGVEPVQVLSYGKNQNWFKSVEKEVYNTRNNVSVFDQTSFSKFLVQGRDSEKVLQKICCANVAVENGKIVYTGLLNSRGGFESDCTVIRLEFDKYFIISSSGQTVRDLNWIKTNIPSDAICTITDVTSSYSVLGVMGPKSREILSEITTADLSDKAFPFGTAQDIEVSMANVLASRITYVGELGWELYIPVEYGTIVYDALHKIGSKYGLKNAGYYAIECMRLEKGYRAWSHDISPDTSPLEAGLGFTVDWTKEFTGKAALEKQKQNGLSKRLVQYQFKDTPEAYPVGNEPVFNEQNVVVGSITSAAFSHTLGYAVGMGYLQGKNITKDFLAKQKLVVSVAGKKCPVHVSFQPAYDPNNTKVKA